MQSYVGVRNNKMCTYKIKAQVEADGMEGLKSLKFDYLQFLNRYQASESIGISLE